MTDMRAPAPILLVRHARVHVEPSIPSDDWKLTPEGRQAARVLGQAIIESGHRFDAVVASAESKAYETALEIAACAGIKTVQQDPRLNETRRPWTEDHGDYKAIVARYLVGDEPDGWESRASVLSRMSAALSEHAAAGRLLVAGHGISMSLWTASAVNGLDPVAFWNAIGYPSAWLVDQEARAMRPVPDETGRRALS